MKVNVLEAHDRLKHLIKDQSANIFQGAEDCLKRNPFSLSIQEKSPYIYIFSHPRTLELDERISKYNKDFERSMTETNYKRKYLKLEDVPDKALFWDPRLSIPEAQSNSYLFRAKSHTDEIEVIWMLPAPEMWDQYDEGKVTESNWCSWSINQYKSNKKVLERPHPEDMPEEKARLIMKAVVDEKLFQVRQDKMMNRIYLP